VEALRLRVEPRDGKPFTHLCEGTAVVFGRASRCDVVLTDRYSSRRHARIFRA
jgi:pSer/pThr/pTyr-binding forkhead associated (FHA) protein